MPNKVIQLATPITLFGKTLDRLELREPKGGEYIAIGEPRVLVYTPSGSGYWVEQPGVLQKYVEKCILHELGEDIIHLLSLDDAMELKESIVGFFVDAAARRAARKSTVSSSA